MSPIYVARASGIAVRLLGNEMIIMSARDSTLVTLNEQATVIWNAADGVTPLRDIVERSICWEFEVDPAEACRDAEEVVQDLARRGILLVSDRPAVKQGGAP